MKLTKEQVVNTLAGSGLEHLSYSAVRDFLEDPRKFRKKWLEKNFDDLRGYPLAEGSAFHAGLASYWNARMNGVTDPVRLLLEAKEGARENIQLEGARTDWKPRRIAKALAADYRAIGCEVQEKTTRSGTAVTYVVPNETMLARDVEKYLEAYVADPPDVDPVAAEIAHVARTKDAETGEYHLLPTKGRIDLVTFRDGTLDIRDHKLVSDDPDQDDETGRHVLPPANRLQASCYDTLAPELADILGVKGVERITFTFDHFNKKTLKRVPVTIELTKADRVAWARLLKGTILHAAFALMLDDDALAFLPNPFVQFGTDGWDEFVRDIRVDLGEEERQERAPAEKYEAYEI